MLRMSLHMFLTFAAFLCSLHCETPLLLLHHILHGLSVCGKFVVVTTVIFTISVRKGLLPQFGMVPVYTGNRNA